jgi:hypothetical protein
LTLLENARLTAEVAKIAEICQRILWSEGLDVRFVVDREVGTFRGHPGEER